MNYGDASIRLPAFPKVPVYIILFKSDGEFSVRSDLLFDSTCSLQLPEDILWSIAMMGVMIML